MLPRDAALADLPTVSTAYPDKSSTAVSPIICSKALENSAIVVAYQKLKPKHNEPLIYKQ
jgi:hypothetical protein